MTPRRALMLASAAGIILVVALVLLRSRGFVSGPADLRAGATGEEQGAGGSGQPPSAGAGGTGHAARDAGGAGDSGGAGAAEVSGVVLDPEGRAVAGAEVAVLAPQGGDTARERRTVLATPDAGELGVYTGELPFPDEVPAASTARPETGGARGPVPVGEPGTAGGPRLPAASGVAAGPGVPGARVFSGGPLASARTGADGAFSLGGLPERRLALRVSHPGFPCGGRATIDLEGGGRRSGVRVAVARGVSVRGRVLGARGEPVGGAAVVARALGERQHEAGSEIVVTTDAAGRFAIDSLCAPASVSASAAGMRSAAREVAASGAQTTIDLSLVADERAVRVRVLDHRGRPASGLRVVLAGGRGIPIAEGVTDGRGEATLGTAAARGAVGDPPWRVEVRGEAHAWLAKDGVHPGEEAAVQLPPAGVLVGVVRDERLGPLVMAYRVELVPKVREAVAPPVTRHGSRFEARPLAAGAWKLVVSAPGYVTHEQDVDVPGGDVPGTLARRELAIALVRAASMRGEVRDERGERIAGALVRVHGRSTLSDARGEFELREVPPGEAVVEASKEGFEPGRAVVRLEAGRETRGVDLRLRRR